MRTLNELARWAMGDHPDDPVSETKSTFNPTVRLCDNGIILTTIYDRCKWDVTVYAFRGNREILSIVIHRCIEPYPTDRYAYVIAAPYDRRDHDTATAKEYCIYADVDDSDRWCECGSWSARCAYSYDDGELDRELTIMADRSPGCIDPASWRLFCEAVR